MTTTSESEPRTYGNWRRPRSAGLGKFGLLSTIIIFAGMIVGIIVLLVAGILGALLVLVLTAAVLALLSLPDRHGLTSGQRLLTRIAWARRKRAGNHLYRSGPLGRTPWGTHQLPGIAARSKLIDTTDGYGRPVAVIHLPTTNHYAVVIGCQPDGAALVDQEQVDQWVAGWGMYLAILGGETSIAAASVTIETAPDTGVRLRREVAGNVVDDAHPLARAVMQEIVQTYPAAAPVFRAWITITFRGTTPSGKRRPVQAMVDDLRTRIPNLVGAVSATGGGAAEPVGAQELCETIRSAYDPVVADVIEDCRANGTAVDLDWSDVGPAAHDTEWDCYRHDGAVSVTWAMTQPPRGLSYSTVLHELLTAHPAINRKRVTLLYRPFSPAVAAAVVDADHRNAQFRLTSSQMPTARQQADATAAAAASAEEARGAGLTGFGLVVTATVVDPAALPDARATITSLSGGARILLRPVYGAQDSAFAMGLPLGLVVSEHLRVPAALRRLS